MPDITLELIATEAKLQLNVTEFPTIELTVGGPQGAKGDTGEGVPAGGTTRQVLMKNSNTDYDTSWKNETYTQNFTNQASVTVTHNLGKKPSVLVTDSTGDEVIGNINHISDNELSISFSSSFTGTVVCN